MVDSDGKEREEMSKEDLERNVTLSLHKNFWETILDPFSCCKQRVEEQQCCTTASNCVRMTTDVLQDTETKSTESMSQEKEMEQ